MENGFEVVSLHGSASGIVPVPVIGENGNWYVGNKDTGVKAKGIDGKNGDIGATGPQGPKGDTGAQGQKGDKGEVGPQGPIGITPALSANLTTEVPGTALDATMGKILSDKTNEINSNLEWSELYNHSLTAGNTAPLTDDITKYKRITFICASGYSWQYGTLHLCRDTYGLNTTYSIPVGVGYIKVKSTGNNSITLIENTTTHALRRIYGSAI